MCFGAAAPEGELLLFSRPANNKMKSFDSLSQVFIAIDVSCIRSRGRLDFLHKVFSPPPKVSLKLPFRSQAYELKFCFLPALVFSPVSLVMLNSVKYFFQMISQVQKHFSKSRLIEILFPSSHLK
jgi:hypothetical protein